jgi:hypothetical protein
MSEATAEPPAPTEPTPEETTAPEPSAEQPQRTYGFFRDEGALARLSTDGMEAPQVFWPDTKQWVISEYVDPIHRSIRLTREQAAQMAGGDEYLDQAVDYEAGKQTGSGEEAAPAPGQAAPEDTGGGAHGWED